MTKLYRLTHTYNMSSGAEKASNSLWFLDDGTSTLGTAAARVDACTGALWTAMRGYVTSLTTVQRIRLDEVNVATGLTITGVDCTIPALAGTAGTDSLPLQCSPVLTIRSATSGRSGRGRIYLPALASSQSFGGSGVIPTATRDALVAGFVAFTGAMKAVGVPLTLSVYSRKLGGTLPVTTVEMDNVHDTQRSRRRSIVGARKVTGV